MKVVQLEKAALAMAFSNPRSIRKSILITSPLALIYNCLVLSVGGAIFEAMSIISAALGIYRNTKKREGA